MSKIRALFKRRWQLPLWADVLILLFAIAAIWFAMALLTQPGFVRLYMSASVDRPMLLLLNILPILFIVTALYLATGRSILSCLLTSGIFFVLGIVNGIKALERGEPFIPADIRLLREALAVVGQYGAQNIIAMLGVVIALVLFGALTIRFFLSAKLHTAVRVAGPLISLALLIALTFTVYADEELYDSFEGVFADRMGNYSMRGFVYSFTHDITALSVNRISTFVTGDFQALEESAPVPGHVAHRPNVVMVMSEAFSELTESPYLDFTNHRDPLENFRRIREESIASGDLIVDVIGGGTIFTEFAALTGISPVTLSDSITPYEFVRDNMDSIVWHFSRLGYDTVALHPFHGWFYNRQNVFPRLGFDTFLYGHTEYHFEGAPLKGNWVSEEATMDALIEILDQRSNLEAPLFLFCTTVQNHGGYYGKYFYDLQGLFDTDLDFDDADLLMLENFTYGLFDIDRELARLTARLEADPEPYVLVYFGDHGPSLRGEIYEMLGMGDIRNRAIDAMQAFKVPFFIWQNEAARQEMDLEERARALGLSADMEASALFIGPMLLQILDFDQWSAFFSHVNELRETFPVIRRGV